ncbi:ATP-dependent RNA helicase HrpA [Pandoraea sputorum]|uniref:ATP-dependent RNA helicase HrpA n=1 Tax=Pandoraea sputorum TaxID=93222 RepID=A0A239SLR7_9BURK|nr:ATP-dependent RNA helicase HrpA [Pandoraea sputorum]
MASDERNRQSKPPKPKVTAPGQTRAQTSGTAQTHNPKKSVNPAEPRKPQTSATNAAQGGGRSARQPGGQGEQGGRGDASRRLSPAERAALDAQRLAARQAAANRVPEIQFPEALPVSGRREEIARAIAGHQVVIVSGETGSGKTTQLPKICLELGRGLGAGGTGLIGHTQPRRIAASATARRIADELNSPLGEIVGFKVRFNDTLSNGASVKLMTDGILLAETQTDPLLRAYDTLIIDEAHERSLNIDFLLGYLKQLLPRRPDLKVIITSATIDADRFARHFGSGEGETLRPAPVIEVSGRLYPVEVRYRPIQDDVRIANAEGREGSRASARDRERDLMDGIVDAVDELCREGSGDVLVFLPGEREIREAAESLRKHHPPHTEILPLFARLSATDQERVFKPSNARRIVLATNVAETSLTVPGIRYVVDAGTARVKRYSYRNKVEQLQIESISQAAANQRAGRCGRVADGICIRLYDETDFQSRARFTDPEILRSSLAAVILRMQSLRLAKVEEFPFIEPPPGRAIADGYQLLNELGAVDDTNQLTPLGRELARLPLDPRVGRMILAARDQQSLREVLIIASGLAVQDPRDRPIEAQDAADNAHKKFADEKSEFLSWIKIWKWFEEAIAHKKSNRLLAQACRENFLSQLRLREWRDVHSQLLTVVREQGWRLNESEATYEQVHLALLAGLLGNIGCKADDDPHFLGAHGIKFHIWPGSSLVKKAGRWVMAGELVETSRLYARCIARIEPEWIERVGKHLVKTSLSDAHWEKKPAQVTAYERGTLYGLTIYARRRMNFGPRDPRRAREIFLRSALVEGEWETKLPFFAHNRKLIADIEQLEHKSRRQDVLVDDELIYAFYDAHVPADLYDGASFEHWYRETAKGSPKLLYLVRDDLMRHEAAGVTTDLFPKKTVIAGVEMALTYHFEPGSPRDGVTLAVPLYALNQVDARRCEWLVPGMLKEKAHLLMKSLPQKLRRHFVPLPEYAAGFLDRATFGQGALLDALMADARELTGVMLKSSDFKLEMLPAHLSMNFKVIDEHGRQLGMGRNLAQLRAELGQQAQRTFQQIAARSGATPTGNVAAESQAGGVPKGGQASEGGKAGKEGGKSPVQGAAPAAAVEPGRYDNLTTWSFGELPEMLEIRRGGQTLFGYPALVDRGDHCDLEVFDDPDEAQRQHRAGLRRLFAIQLREQVKYLEKNIPGLQQMAMQYMGLGTQEELRDQIVDLSLERACLQLPWPGDNASFVARKDEGRGRLTLLAQEIARLAGQILTEYAALQKKLAQAKPFAQAHADMTAQLQRLIGKRFLIDTPYAQLAHFPRYLKAMAGRIDKLKADPTRDARAMSELGPLLQNWQRATSQRRDSHDARLDEFRWLLEELRVSLFAQELRTPMPVSVKRLHKVWEALQR